MARLLGVLIVHLLLFATLAHADVFRPAYLQLKQLDAETFDVTWKVPALDAQTTLKVKPAFPAARRRSAYGPAFTRWVPPCSAGGYTLQVD